MLNSTKIEIFKNLTHPKIISELTASLDMDHSTISKAVNSLENAGLVTKQKKSQKVYVSRSESLHSQSLREILIEYPRLPLDNILTNSSLHILSVLKNPYSIIEIAEITGLNRKTVSSALYQLTKYGIVLKKENRYYFSERHSLVENFVDNYWKYRTNKNLKAISENAVLIWQMGPEFLFKIDVEFKNKIMKKKLIQPTAINVFHRYDLKVMSNTEYYFYSKRELKTEDHIIHTILIDPYSSIYNSYALALYSKTCPPELVKYSQFYNIEKHVKLLMEYLDQQKKNTDFVLPWNEYQDLVRDLQ